MPGVNNSLTYKKIHWEIVYSTVYSTSNEPYINMQYVTTGTAWSQLQYYCTYDPKSEANNLCTLSYKEDTK